MNKIAKISFAILVLINLILLTFLVLGRPPHKHKNPKEIVQEHLHLDDLQIENYENIIAKHRSELRKKQEEISKEKNKLYKGLALTPSVFNDSIANRIGTIHKEMDLIHFNHFQSIKGLLKESQKEKFNSLVSDFETIFRPKHKGHPRERK